MKDKLFIKKPRTISLSIYFVILTTIIIVIITTLFAVYLMLNIKNLTSKYESDIYSLRYSLSTILVETLKLDTQKKDFKTTEKIIDFLQQGNFVSYIQVKDNKTGKIKIETAHNQKNLANENLRNLSTTINDEYTLYFGIPVKDDSQVYFDDFSTFIFNVIALFVALGFIAAYMMSNTISTPMKKLSDAAKEITDGNFDVQIEKSRFFEINSLISSYNEMAFQLHELYASLELKVQERTIALESANHKLKETQAMMVHSEKMRSLGELVAGIAHEINNPVNFIHGNIIILQNYVDDLLKLIQLYDENSITLPEDIKAKITSLRKEIDLDFLKDDVKDLIKSCMEGTQRTKNIVLDLKNFSRMEEVVLSQFDISKEIDTTLNILNNKYKNRITVIKNYEQGIPKIEAYGGQLNQVFMNILDNAQDAMGESGTLTINISKVNNGNSIKLEFIDTGAGIPPENLKKVFDPFFTTKPVGKGTGLGMSITYRVIKDHNGTIDVESEVGRGTKFTIVLPVNHESSSEEKIVDNILGKNGVKNNDEV